MAIVKGKASELLRRIAKPKDLPTTVPTTAKRLYVERSSLEGIKVSARTRARMLAFQSLYAYEHDPRQGGGTVERILDVFRADNPSVGVEAKGLAEELFRGTLERRVGIDARLRPRLKGWSWSRLSNTNKAILRMSVYSLVFQGTNKRIAIDEAVKLSKIFGAGDDYKFINALLDGLSKDLEREQI